MSVSIERVLVQQKSRHKFRWLVENIDGGNRNIGERMAITDEIIGVSKLVGNVPGLSLLKVDLYDKFVLIN